MNLKTTLIALALLAFFILIHSLPFLQEEVTTQRNWPKDLAPCQYEDSDNCYWDASTRGNGQGRSFYTIDGEVHYLP